MAGIIMFLRVILKQMQCVFPSLTAPADYSAIDIELCFTMNVSEQTILIPVINDDLHEPDESFSAQLNLTGDLSTGVQLGQASAIVAISDSNSKFRNNGECSWQTHYDYLRINGCGPALPN